MGNSSNTIIREHIESIYRKSLRAVDPYRLVSLALQPSSAGLSVGEVNFRLDEQNSCFLVAMGKAAGPMARAALDVFPKITAGVVALPEHDVTKLAPHIEVFHAGHPIPNPSSLAAAIAGQGMLARCKAGDLVIVLVSGGGSALFELPVTGVSLNDLAQINELLLASGLPIQSMNIIRIALSQVKGGGLARIASPARVAGLVLSDVVGDQLGSVASGPTVLRPDQRAKARMLIEQSGLWHRVSGSIRSSLAAPAQPRNRTPRPANYLLGGNRQMVEGAEAAAEGLDYHPRVLSRRMQGEARLAGGKFARRLLHLADQVTRPTCFIMGGETTVTLKGAGKGGRNQEFALAAAQVLAGHQRIVIASLASDGRDGPTEVAGSIVDGQTYERIKKQGWDPQQALDENNSYPVLALAEALFETGPTGTNVADLVLGLVVPPAQPQSPTTRKAD